MKRWPIMIVVFALLGAIAVAQQPEGPVITSDLVHWSYMQQPQQPEQKQPGQTPTAGATAKTQPAECPTYGSRFEAIQLQNSITPDLQDQTRVGSNAVAPRQENVTGLEVAPH